MFTLRGTKRLLARMNVTPASETTAPTTLLGDWYANLVYAGRLQLVLAVSERTFLSVVIPAAPSASLLVRFRGTTRDVLRAVGLNETSIARELSAMEHANYGKATNRQAIGVLVDFAKAVPFYVESAPSLLAVSLKLAGTPCGPLYKSTVFPDRATLALFTSSAGSVVHRPWAGWTRPARAWTSGRACSRMLLVEEQVRLKSKSRAATPPGKGG